MARHISPTRTKRDEFTERVQSLPAELYNHIQKLTFTVDSTQPCKIESEYTPPVSLHMDRAFRKVFAKPYYSGTKFQSESLRLSRTWLKVLPEEHRRQIRNLRAICVTPKEVLKKDRAELRDFFSEMTSMNADVHHEIKGFLEDAIELEFTIDFTKQREEASGVMY